MKAANQERRQGSPLDGRELLDNGGAHHNQMAFAIRQAIGEVRTHAIVKVVAVHPNPNGALLPPTVDFQIMTKQLDGMGTATSHGTVYSVPVKRSQGGDCCVINDPVVGDIGEVAIHDRDISSVMSSQSEGNPGSRRQFSLSDSTYYGTIGSKTTPAHFIQFARDGNGNVTSVNLTSSAGWNINGITVDKNGNAAFPGTVTAVGNVTAGYGGGDSVTLQDHLHPGTQKPTPGT